MSAEREALQSAAYQPAARRGARLERPHPVVGQARWEACVCLGRDGLGELGVVPSRVDEAGLGCVGRDVLAEIEAALDELKCRRVVGRVRSVRCSKPGAPGQARDVRDRREEGRPCRPGLGVARVETVELAGARDEGPEAAAAVRQADDRRGGRAVRDGGGRIIRGCRARLVEGRQVEVGGRQVDRRQVGGERVGSEPGVDPSALVRIDASA